MMSYHNSDGRDPFLQTLVATPTLYMISYTEKERSTKSIIMNSPKSPSPEDLISKLPDPLLCNIISHLGIEETIRTGILSTRWKDLWKYTPTLKFDHRTMIRPPPLPPQPPIHDFYTSTLGVPTYNYNFDQSMDAFLALLDDDGRAMETVDGVLAAHKAPLRCCTLIHGHFAGVDEKYLVHKWINRLKTDKAIQELHLNRTTRMNRINSPDSWYSETNFQLLEGTFRCQTLSYLSLKNYPLPNASPFLGCMNLVTLKFVQVRMGSETLVRVLFNCALLEKLSIIWCRGFKVLKIWHKNLKFLELVDLVLDKMEVHASGLKKLVVDSTTAGTQQIGLYTPNLSELRVGGDNEMTKNRNISDLKEEGKKICKNTSFLERCCGLIECRPAGEDDNSTYRLMDYNYPIDNLSVLSVTLDLNKIKAQIVLSQIFRVCKSLNTLYITVLDEYPLDEDSVAVKNPYGVRTDESQPRNIVSELPYDKALFWDMRELSDSLSHHMKVVWIRSFRPRQLELDFASYLIRNAPVLQQLGIEFSGLCSMETVTSAQELLLSLPTASLDVDIVFTHEPGSEIAQRVDELKNIVHGKRKLSFEEDC